MVDRRRDRSRTIALGYILAGLAWVIGTSAVVSDFTVTTASLAETVKGSAFVLVTGSALLILLSRNSRRLAERDELVSTDAALQQITADIDDVLLAHGRLEPAFDLVCDRLRDRFEAELVWIGCLVDGRLRPSGRAGPAAALADVLADAAGDRDGHRPERRAIEVGGPVRTVADPRSPWGRDVAAPGIAEAVVTSFVDRQGQPAGVVGLYRRSAAPAGATDALATAAARLGAALALAEDQQLLRRLAAAANSAVNAMFIFDTDHRIIWVNDAFTRLTGYPAGEALGQDPRRLLGTQPTAEAEATSAPARPQHRTVGLDAAAVAEREAADGSLEAAVRTGSSWHGELLNRDRDGRLFLVRQTVTPVRDATGAVIEFVAIDEDLSERRAVEQRLEHVLTHDEVTGLVNRAQLDLRLAQACEAARAGLRRFALMVVDLDHFDAVNDSHGNPAGDYVLRVMGQRLERTARPVDTVGRLEGDEFAVLAEDVGTPAAAAVLVDRLLETARAPVELDGERTFLTATAGVVLIPDARGDDLTPATVLSRAAVALRQAKATARGRSRFFHPQTDRRAAETLRLRNGLHEALAAGHLRLHYQPKVRLGDRAVVGVEALVRWHHPDEGVIGPDAFIPVAEETGMIVPLTEWILETAVRDCLALRAQAPDLRVAVNVSPVHVGAGGVADLVDRTLAATGLPAGALEIELTEGALARGATATAELQALDELDVQLAIDDFGIGYSSVSRLRDLPIDIIKVDRTFVTGLPDDVANAAIVPSMAELAHQLGAAVVAEGIETPEELRFVADCGCDVGQGYLFGRPQTRDDVARWLGSHQARLPARRAG